MAFRADVTVEWRTSPRVITVAAPSVEITIQDLVDTCRVLESQIENLDSPSLITAAGKENLGGGVQVGITATLLDALVSFEGRGGPSYVQCRVNGGNLVAVDSNNSYFDTPISPTSFTQVVTTASSSATTQNQSQLEHNTFNGGVTLDVTNGVAGTTFPIGTDSDPVNNLDDAKLIAAERGFRKLFVKGDWTLADIDVLEGFSVVGESPTSTQITLTAAATVDNCQFTLCHVTGEIDSPCTFRQCEIHDIQLFRGYLLECSLHGTIVLGGGIEADILSCYSGHADQDVIVNMGGSGQNASFRAWSGKLKITNMTDASVTCAVDMIGGEVEVDFTTVTAGNIACQGNGEVKDSVSGDMLIHAWYGDVYIDNYAMNGRFQQEMWQGFGLDKNHPEQVGRFSKIIANAVWDEAVADHSDAEATFGRTLKHLGHIPKSIYFDGDIVYADRALPPELLTNGDLFNDDYWIADAGWRIQNGEAYANVADDTALLTHPIMLANGGQQYIYKFTVKDYESGQVRLHADGGDGAWHTGNGTFSLVVTPSFSSTYIALQGHPTEGFKGQITEVSLRRYEAFNGNGKEAYPFNNLGDALDMYETFGFNRFVVKSDIILDRNLKNINIVGVGVPEVDLNGFDIKNTEINQCKIKGEFTGTGTVFRDSVLLTGAYLDGFIENCALAGDLICNDGANVLLKDCASIVPGTGRPTISMNATGTSLLSLRGYSGGMTIKDCNQPTDVTTVEVAQGSLTFDNSCTNGEMVARGLCVFVDETNGATVVDQTLDPTLAGGSLTPTQDTRLKELWQIQGLDAANQMAVTDTTRVVDAVNQTWTDDGTTTTVTRS